MKKKYLLIALAVVSFLGACDVVKSVATQAANDVLTGATTGTTSTIPALTQTEAAGGLKDALVNGVLNGTGALGKVGAFASNPSIKIQALKKA